MSAGSAVAGRGARCWSPAPAGSSAATSSSRSLERGARVRAFVRYNVARRPRLARAGSTARLRDEVDVFRGDLANPEAVRSALARLRGRPPPRRADPDPVLVPSTRASSSSANVDGTLNVLEAARASDADAHRPHLDERGLRHRADASRSTRSTRCTRSRRTRRRRSAPTSSRSATSARSGCRSSSRGRSTPTARGRAPAR